MRVFAPDEALAFVIERVSGRLRVDKEKSPRRAVEEPSRASIVEAAARGWPRWTQVHWALDRWVGGGQSSARAR